MKIDAKIGKIQIIIGIILLLLVIIGTPISVKSYFYNPIVEGSTSMIEVWSSISEGMNTSTLIPGHITSDLIILSATIRTSLVIFLSLSVMMFFLSIMFILQGLANIKRK